MDTAPKLMYEWKNLPWRKLEVQVFKLQKRIYQASIRGDVKTVRRLQRLLIKSRAAKLLAVRKVTQDNRGKSTACVDGVKNLHHPQRLQLAQKLKLPTKVMPIRRVWIPKLSQDEKRPLGIPTIRDRAAQALAKLALEPEWEARFEPHSYGFRPGRSAHDAVKYLFLSIRRQDKYVLDADISKCFDRINHNALLSKLNTFPLMRRAIKAWLKSGVMEENNLFPTNEGTPQGGVLSPLLANVALHGLEEYIQSAFPKRKLIVGVKEANWKPIIVRYADDLIIMHRDEQELKRASYLAQKWLEKMGLELSPTKTRICHTFKEDSEEKPGFDFLGFTFQQYPLGKRNRRFVAGNGYRREVLHKTIITPTGKAIKRHKAKLSQIIDGLKTAPQSRLIRELNPVITGWATYYSAVNSKEIFGEIDHWLFIKLRRWANRRHPMKSKHWIAGKYWGIDTKGVWEFTDGADSLKNHRETPIRMHVNVKEARSPFDGDWTYWSKRTGEYPGIRPILTSMLKSQKGRCPCCNLYFHREDIIEVHHIDGNRSNRKFANLQALHGHCHDTQDGIEVL
ncbi:group II intron reverse transcriptase/maturase [Nostoc sp. MG11]|uniref:group II intron reverse transcriptase/maturase n=1 Tax=Nostoc sp. MG11 TaxID=2721166 RepID=UPI0018667056|nr:group II intron reverse transcriptase/maturase [Nostoc sp. MG11]